METIVFSRTELYDLVWSTPLNALIKKYSVSYSELRKACSEMNIPLPRLGHWENLRRGKVIIQDVLPSEDNVPNEVVLKIKDTKKTQVQKEDSAENHLMIKVPEKLLNPDKLIITAKEYLTRKDRYLHNGIARTQLDQLNVNVAPVNIVRALCFVN